MVKGSGVAVRPDSVAVEFDDERLVANAGVILTSTLINRLGLERLVDQMVDLGQRPGAARPGRKVCSLVHAMVLGADSIDDCDVLRAGGTEALLGHRVMAPSTLGTFLRSFSFGHVRQLDRVLAESIRRAWSAGRGGRCSVAVTMHTVVADRIALIPEQAWQPVADYPDTGVCELAETTLGDERLVVRRVHLHAQEDQTELFAYWRHFAFVTNRSEDLHTVDREHRQHAEVELAIRDLKDQALAHFPSGRFGANGAWTVIACLAHNLQRWTGMLGLEDATPRAARTIRRWLLAIPGRLTRTARRWTLHLPAR